VAIDFYIFDHFDVKKGQVGRSIDILILIVIFLNLKEIQMQKS
jgi:hypothetical protein